MDRVLAFAELFCELSISCGPLDSLDRAVERILWPDDTVVFKPAANGDGRAVATLSGEATAELNLTCPP